MLIFFVFLLDAQVPPGPFQEELPDHHLQTRDVHHLLLMFDCFTVLIHALQIVVLHGVHLTYLAQLLQQHDLHLLDPTQHL